MSQSIEVKIPDIGDYENVPVIEILVRAGDIVEKEQSLITLESDKTTVDVPSPMNGIVKELKVKVGDTVSKGTLFLLLEAQDAATSSLGAYSEAAIAKAPVAQQAAYADDAPQQMLQCLNSENSAVIKTLPIPISADNIYHTSHASPSVRKFARELGVDVAQVRGMGLKGRITQNDVTAFIKDVMIGQTTPTTMLSSSKCDSEKLNVLPWTKSDFAKFGQIEVKPLSRIKKISGANLHRNWTMIPHVTNNDEADITELEAWRVQLNKEHEKTDVKFTILSFVIKACVAALQKFPTFNASLDDDSLVYKKYYHISFAADTPNGLVVPVIQDADKKGLFEIAKEISFLAQLARASKLKPDQMKGGCFSISSLGSIGGTNFTPIINAPEVAILGLMRSTTKPVWDGKQFLPHLMLPLSLSYDHRVIDGAEAARFNTYLASILADFRRMIL